MLVLFLNAKKSSKLANKKMCSDKLVAAGHVLSRLLSVQISSMRKLFEKLLVTSEDREKTMGSYFGYQIYNPALADNEQVENPMRLHAAFPYTSRILVK